MTLTMSAVNSTSNTHTSICTLCALRLMHYADEISFLQASISIYTYVSGFFVSAAARPLIICRATILTDDRVFHGMIETNIWL